MKHAATRKMSRIQDIQLIFLSDRKRFRKISVRPATAEFACFNPWRFSFSDSVKNEPISSQTSLQALWEWPQSEAKENKMQLIAVVSVCVSLCQFVSVCVSLS